MGQTDIDITAYEVGGCVRDKLLGLRSNDIDYAVEAPSFEAMTMWLLNEGFEIFLSTEEYLTIRARFPRDTEKHEVPAEWRGMTADFVLCRKDGPSTDGRRPDFVEPGTIEDDLARRDFTMNAMANLAYSVTNGWGMWHTGQKVIDPHGGRVDLSHQHIRFVGDPMTRLREDGLRALRAIRFAVTKSFNLDPTVVDVLQDAEVASLLGGVSEERVREELHKAFKHDTLKTLHLLSMFPYLEREMFSKKLWLEPTLKS